MSEIIQDVEYHNGKKVFCLKDRFKIIFRSDSREVLLNYKRIKGVE